MNNKKKFLLILGLLSLFLVGSFSFLNYDHHRYQYVKNHYDKNSVEVDGSRLDTFLQDLTTIQRHDEDGLTAARRYIVDVLEPDYEVKIQEFEYNYDTAYSNMRMILSYDGADLIEDKYYVISDDERKNHTGHNIIAVREGKSEAAIILSAHYDTTYKSFGAYDNASGVAALLEMAQVFSQIDPDVTIYFVFFSQEELGLIGSRYFVSQLNERQLSNIIGNINIDCIGEAQSGDVVLYTCSGGKNDMTELFTPNELVIEKMIYSDHSSFWTKKIPAVWISQERILESNSNSMQDLYQDMDIKLFQETVEMLTQTLKNNFINSN